MLQLACCSGSDVYVGSVHAQLQGGCCWMLLLLDVVVSGSCWFLLDAVGCCWLLPPNSTQHESHCFTTNYHNEKQGSYSTPIRSQVPSPICWLPRPICVPIMTSRSWCPPCTGMQTPHSPQLVHPSSSCWPACHAQAYHLGHHALHNCTTAAIMPPTRVPQGPYHRGHDATRKRTNIILQTYSTKKIQQRKLESCLAVAKNSRIS